ncbi:phospholipase D family protein [Halobaculum marinum]|uniref:Phospholipase D family protein n=1 Tax=Halobaculum marinum TaxID=3031996 RepID=A0ABD5WQ87_9EURY|nr:phospholipase D family protein [Halobaculum sp. DT55]
MEYKTPISVPSWTGDGEVSVELELAMVRSWRTFVGYFGETKSLRAVTYSQSPQVLHKLFASADLELEQLEVVIGDHRQSKYRKQLQGDLDLAKHLNHLLEQDQLQLFTLDKRVTLHSKLYIAENSDGSRLVVFGSPNLSKEAWSGNQTNLVVAFRTEGDSIIDGYAQRFYEAHREQCELFMGDLTEQLAETDDPEERERIFDLWVDGTVPSDNPTGDLHRRIVELFDEEESRVRRVNVVTDSEEADEVVKLPTDGSGAVEDTDVQSNQQMRLSPQGLEEPIKSAEPTLSRHNVSVKPTELRGSAAGFDRYLRAFNDDFPTMWVNRDKQIVRMQLDNTTLEMTAPLPDDPAEVDEALAHIEEYIETVERFGDAKRPQETMAHFYEAIIYVFWAPFANYFAQEYANRDGAELDKDLPFLYVHGQNDSGKGMFLRFAANIISNGVVAAPVEGQQFTKDAIDRCRASNTVFPFLVDDVDKDRVERDIVKTYWTGAWDGSVAFPTFIFTSNDGNPKSEYRTRMKMLEFDVVFNVEGHEREETARLIKKRNLLFSWFAHLLFQKEIRLPDQEDKLAVAREVFCDLYDYAGRDRPDYFPAEAPAERIHDHGRRKWVRAYRTGLFNIREENGILLADFSENLDGYAVHKYDKVVPSTIRTEIQRTRIQFEQPERFYEWTGIEPETHGFLARLWRRP